MTLILIIALIAVSGVIAGMSLIGGEAEHGSIREWAGAVLMLASVLLIPVSAAIWALA